MHITPVSPTPQFNKGGCQPPEPPWFLRLCLVSQRLQCILLALFLDFNLKMTVILLLRQCFSLILQYNCIITWQLRTDNEIGVGAYKNTTHMYFFVENDWKGPVHFQGFWVCVLWDSTGKGNYVRVRRTTCPAMFRLASYQSVSPEWMLHSHWSCCGWYLSQTVLFIFSLQRCRLFLFCFCFLLPIFCVLLFRFSWSNLGASGCD